MTTGGGVVNYAYDAANRLTSVNGQAHTWDNNGNLLSDGVRSYTYDHANRLTQVVSGTLTTQFTYDGLGNRTATTVDGVTTRYALDVAGGLPEVIVATTGGASTQYLQVEGQILAQHDSGTWGYILPDHLGSVRIETDALGQVTVARHFDPFGVPMQADGGSPFGYTGEWWESHAELLYLRARYYAPEVGRFISKDPFPSFDTSPQTLNAYQYVVNNVINLVDPSGRIPNEPEIIQGRFTYSCNCGWIDWAHAEPGRTLRILEIVDAAIASQSDSHIPHLAYYEHPFPVPGIGPVETAGPLRFNPNLTFEDRLSVALGIYQESEERFESFWSSRYSRLANVLPPIGERPSSWGPIQDRFSDTYFTEEDLPSDLIGFYRAIDDDLKSPAPGLWEDNKDKLADICGFPKEKDRALRWSRRVYSHQMDLGMGWERITEWGKARLVTDWDPDVCEDTSWAMIVRGSVRYTCGVWGYTCQWPSRFNRISPERSKVGGKWWWAEGLETISPEIALDRNNE